MLFFRQHSYNGELKVNRILELEEKVKEQNILLKERSDSNRSEIESKNIHIQLLESNIETLKDQLSSSAEQRNELESEKAKVVSLKKELEYVEQIKNKLSDLTAAAETREMSDEVSFIKTAYAKQEKGKSYTLFGELLGSTINGGGQRISLITVLVYCVSIIGRG